MSAKVEVKVYAGIHPAGPAEEAALRQVLGDWQMDQQAVELEGDILRISFEGLFFPAEDCVNALKPLLTEQSRGKVDRLDLENWLLERWILDYGRVSYRRASLDQALESCSRPN